MELDQLRHFVMVAELENFTRAAELAGLSQPALSRSIARLEASLGQPLLDRQTRRTRLNDAGRLLLDRARKILMMVDDARAEIRDDGQSGRVRIGAIPTVAPFLLPERLKSFQKLFPKAQLVVLEETTDNLLKKTAEGEVDIAIAALPIAAKHIDVEVLFEEELFLVTHRRHPLSQKATVQLHDLEEQPFVLLGEAHCLSETVIAFCQRKSFHPVLVERTSQLAMVQELVALGHGVSLIPAMARARDASPARVYRSLAGQKPTRTLAMITNPYRFHSQLVERFQEHLRKLTGGK